jgi:predicted Zn-dependent protease
MLLLPEQQEIAMGVSAYEEVMSSEPPSTNTRYIQMVDRVGKRIADVSDRADYQWEFRVLQSDTQNAFCLPGGKVAVYEGILPACANEAGLAVVMSHEIGHALARHGGERMSHNYAVEGVRQAVHYITRKQEEKNRELVLQAYGVASKYGVVLPYSRKHESEADHMGMMLMAEAGYDPAEAPRFWSRFGAMKQGPKPPEFLSTHPSDERRAQDLTELLPEADELYAATSTKYGVGEQLAAVGSSGPVLNAPAGAPEAQGFFPGQQPRFQPAGAPLNSIPVTPAQGMPGPNLYPAG